MNVNEIFTAEWLAKFKLNRYTLDQVQVAMNDYVSKTERLNEIRSIVGKKPETISLERIANTSTPSEIVNNYPGMVTRELEKMEMRLADFNANR